MNRDWKVLMHLIEPKQIVLKTIGGTMDVKGDPGEGSERGRRAIEKVSVIVENMYSFLTESWEK